MQHAKFGIERELHDKLFYKECENDSGDLHFHSQIELCIIDEGEMEVLINDKRKRLKKGEMSVPLSYDAHVYKPIEYSKSTVFIIPLYMSKVFMQKVKHKRVQNPFICDLTAVNQIKACFNEIKKENVNEVKLVGLVNVILGIILDNLYFEFTDESFEPELSSKILFYIHENFKTNISLELLASHFGYSPSYISRYFKACFGVGIKQYLCVIRLKNAIMLMHEKHNITYCALESGFNSLCTFYRTFYNEFHCSPKEYLK